MAKAWGTSRPPDTAKNVRVIQKEGDKDKAAKVPRETVWCIIIED